MQPSALRPVIKFNYFRMRHENVDPWRHQKNCTEDIKTTCKTCLPPYLHKSLHFPSSILTPHILLCTQAKIEESTWPSNPQTDPSFRFSPSTRRQRSPSSSRRPTIRTSSSPSHTGRSPPSAQLQETFSSMPVSSTRSWPLQYAFFFYYFAASFVVLPLALCSQLLSQLTALVGVCFIVFCLICQQRHFSTRNGRPAMYPPVSRSCRASKLRVPTEW